jgi:hypothetical protein
MGAPPKNLVGGSETGYMNAALFIGSLLYSVDYIKPVPENKE